MASKPATIQFRANGVRIDAEFADSIASNLLQKLIGLGEKVVERKAEHDFDVVLRVIEIGDPAVLRSIIDRATARLQAS